MFDRRSEEREDDRDSRPSTSLTSMIRFLTGKTYLLVPALCVIAALMMTIRQGHSPSVYSLTNFLGPVAYSVATQHNLDVTIDDLPFARPVVFHSARMPLPPVFLAAANAAAGGRMWLVFVLKTITFLIPLALAMHLASEHASRKALAHFLLILPFFVPNFLLQTTSMQFEEGFYYGMLGLAVAILLFFRELSGRWVALFGLMLALLFLSKSSLRFACAVMLLLGCYRMKRWTGRVLLASFVVLVAISWGLYQRHESGRFTLGSALDYMNFHKGNNPYFLSHYPPADNGYIDQYDWMLSPPRFFSSEWAYGDYHMKAAKAFLRNHPGEALRADTIKFWVFWFSLRDIGTGHFHDAFTKIDPANMLLMRLLMLSAVAAALYSLRRSETRTEAVLTLAIFAAVCTPYIAGFVLTRHASVLIYPSALALVRFLAGPSGSQKILASPGEGEIANFGNVTNVSISSCS